MQNLGLSMLEKCKNRAQTCWKNVISLVFGKGDCGE